MLYGAFKSTLNVPYFTFNSVNGCIGGIIHQFSDSGILSLILPLWSCHLSYYRGFCILTLFLLYSSMILREFSLPVFAHALILMCVWVGRGMLRVIVCANVLHKSLSVHTNELESYLNHFLSWIIPFKCDKFNISSIDY